MSAAKRHTGFWIGAVLAALLIAGVGSYYASSSPDGLERTAEDVGFAHTAQDSATADSPLAHYSVSGVDDGRLSGGLAGVIGVAVTLVLAGGVTLLVRRRRTGGSDAEADTPADAGADAGADTVGTRG